MKNEEFENIRARSICKEQSGQNNRKIAVLESNSAVVKVGNWEPKTGNKNNKTGPQGFEPWTPGLRVRCSTIPGNHLTYFTSRFLDERKPFALSRQKSKGFELSYGPKSRRLVLEKKFKEMFSVSFCFPACCCCVSDRTVTVLVQNLQHRFYCWKAVLEIINKVHGPGKPRIGRRTVDYLFYACRKGIQRFQQSILIRPEMLP
jgi:hypothetical protein